MTANYSLAGQRNLKAIPGFYVMDHNVFILRQLTKEHMQINTTIIDDMLLVLNELTKDLQQLRDILGIRKK